MTKWKTAGMTIKIWLILAIFSKNGWIFEIKIGVRYEVRSNANRCRMYKFHWNVSIPKHEFKFLAVFGRFLQKWLNFWERRSSRDMKLLLPHLDVEYAGITAMWQYESKNCTFGCFRSVYARMADFENFYGPQYNVSLLTPYIKYRMIGPCLTMSGVQNRIFLPRFGKECL